MISHGIVDGPHGLILARIPGDAGPLAELVRGHYVGERWLREVRDLAALLAESRPVHHLLPLFGRVPVEPDTWAELIACLAQELVVRRVNLTRVPAAVRCADALRESGHPLAGLPLRLGRGGAVWRSIAGLVRAPAEASVHRVNELAARWRWLVFRITRRTPYWTDQKLAVGALSPRGNVLSLLVSHDTD